MKKTILGLCLLATIGFSQTDSIAQSDVESDFLDLINQYRSASSVCWTGQQLSAWPAGSTPNLKLSPKLSEAARRHNVAMIELSCTQHTCPGEPHLTQRVAEVGYTNWSFLSENIAGGYETAADVFAVWKQSNGHNRNMLTCHAHAIGISMVFDQDSMAWYYWTTDFGDVVDEANAPNPKPKPISSSSSIPEQIDANDNSVIGDSEINNAISFWVLGNNVPGTNETITDNSIMNLIELWITGENI
jgi:uncharacterized protein YkwD